MTTTNNFFTPDQTAAIHNIKVLPGWSVLEAVNSRVQFTVTNWILLVKFCPNRLKVIIQSALWWYS